MLQKYFGEFLLLQTKVFEWHKAFSQDREVLGVKRVNARDTKRPESFSKTTSRRRHKKPTWGL